MHKEMTKNRFNEFAARNSFFECQDSDVTAKQAKHENDEIFLYCLGEQFLKNLYIFLSFINNTLHDDEHKSFEEISMKSNLNKKTWNLWFKMTKKNI